MTGNRLYLVRLAVTLVVGMILGAIVPRHLGLGADVEAQAGIAWALLVGGQALHLWGAAWSGALRGFGHVSLHLSIATAVNIAGLVAQMVVAMAGGGLIGLACVAAPMPVISRHVTICIMRRLHPEIETKAGKWDSGLARSMLQPSIAAWLLTVSYFVVLRADSFLIGGLVGVQEISRYFAAMQIYNSLLFASSAIFLGAVPLLSQKWAKGGGRESFERQSLRLIAGAQFTAAAGAGCLAAIGDRLIGLWIGAENYIGDTVIWLLCIRLFFDAAQGAVLNVARSTEFEKFTLLGIAGAGVYVGLAVPLAGSYGIAGIVVANIVAQGLTLNSTGIVVGARRIGDGALRGIVAILAEALCVGAIAFVAARLALHLLGSFWAGPPSTISELIVIGSAMAITAVVLSAAIWIRIFTPVERSQFLSLVRKAVGAGNKNGSP